MTSGSRSYFTRRGEWPLCWRSASSRADTTEPCVHAPCARHISGGSCEIEVPTENTLVNLGIDAIVSDYRRLGIWAIPQLDDYLVVGDHTFLLLSKVAAERHLAELIEVALVVGERCD